MPITKPPGIESDAFKSAKWDELTQGREFAQSDAPALSLLCQWYKIADTAQDELDGFGGQTAYSNDMGDLKAFPQISTLKTASAVFPAHAGMIPTCASRLARPQRVPRTRGDDPVHSLRVHSLDGCSPHTRG